MKRFLAMTLLLLTLCAFVACSDGPKEYNGYKMIANTDVTEYYFYVPESWDVDRQDGMTAAHVSSSDLTNVSLTTHELPADAATQEAYCTKYETDLKTIGTPAYVKYREARLLGTKPATQYEYTMAIGTTTYHYMQIICLHNGRAYLFTYTAASQEKYNEHRETVDKLLGVFAFTE
jgi:hypothetical protein